MKLIIHFLAIGILSIALFSCGNSEQPEQEEAIIKEDIQLVQELAFPSAKGSSIPNLHLGDNGNVYLTYTTKQEGLDPVLYYSNLIDNKWQKPIKIATGNDWVVNWADFPSLTQFGENLVVNVLAETNPETYAYDVQLMISNDNGKTWGKPFSPHTDGTQTEHGFVSLIPYNDESFMAVWLDGRGYDAGKDEMSLRAAIINKDGKTEQEFVLDERVCDCCATDAVKTKNGIAVVYRNRDENEIRDMSMVLFKDGKWTAPILVAQDQWKIAGCPVNGPAIDVIDDNIAVAWFTSSNDNPTVNVALSNGVESFSPPVSVNTLSTIGRVDICLINKNTAAISWMEGDEKETYLKVRTIKIDDIEKKGESIIVTKMNGSRLSGFPKMIKKGNNLLFTWTYLDDKQNSKIKTAIIETSNF